MNVSVSLLISICGYMVVGYGTAIVPEALGFVMWAFGAILSILGLHYFLRFQKLYYTKLWLGLNEE